MNEKALGNVKVLELGQLIAGPSASRLFAEFGADVIKVETPGSGDPLRNWRVVENGTSLWWHLQGRNKKSICIDLKTEDGQNIIKELVKEIDILVENFKPGTLEKWNIGYEDLKAINPSLIMIRISGYGQDGPYRDKAGFGSIGEAMGGLRYLTGFPDRPPTRVGVSLGDTLASLYAVIGGLMALHHRNSTPTREGQYVDVALYEAIFSTLESTLSEYDFANIIRERTGSTLPGITPSSTYLCKDGKYVVIGANGDSIFKRLMNIMNMPHYAEDDRFSTNAKRSMHAEHLDEVIENWTKEHTLEEVLDKLEKANVPSGSIYSIEDIVQDPHYQARNMIEEHEIEQLGKLKIPGIVPKLSKTPGRTEWTGPKLGEHTETVLQERLNLAKEEIHQLKEKGIID
ncbi:MAG TPA: CaiB/BaiF CoA-transferase family protein [Ureibacillus sp.]|nr:CaiB/BaiF CoA-transferase family protein [Ureibacillus sp.]